MEKQKIVKFGMMALGMILTAASSFVQSKNQDATIKEEISKEVAKHFDKMKES